MKKWECVVCGFIYDEAEGLPEEGTEPGNASMTPEDWVLCGVGKEDRNGGGLSPPDPDSAPQWMRNITSCPSIAS